MMRENGLRLRDAAIATFVGYLMMFGSAFASMGALPRLYVADDAAKTFENVAGNPRLLGFAICAFLVNFLGDLLAAWGLYVLLKPANASLSMFVAWLRVAFSALGLAILMNLVTAYRLVTRASALKALGQTELNTQVHVAVTSFNAQFAFSLAFFGVYLLALGWLIYRSGYLPRWLGVVLALNGAIWLVMEVGPLLWPGVRFGPLFYATFVEMLLPLWLVGWGRRLPETAPAPIA
jgi:hypothetical protein